MDLTTAVVMMIGCALTYTSTSAVTVDDAKWINQCVMDNHGDAPDAMQAIRLVCLSAAFTLC